MPYIKWNDWQVHYENHGHGPVMLLVHGWAQSSRCWLQVVPELQAHNRVICIDLPGFGGSDKPKNFNYSMDDMGQMLADFMRHMNLHEVLLGGHSMGGVVALLASLAAPELLRGLVLMNTPIQGPAQWRFIGALPLAPLLVDIGRRNDLVVRLGAMVVTGRWNYDGTSVLQDVGRMSAAACGRTSRELVRLDLREAARRVSVPTLVIGSTGDLIVPPRDANQLAELIPTAFEPVHLEGVRHMPMVEAPQRLAGLLHAFLRRVPPKQQPA